jgi:hypothetical protein
VPASNVRNRSALEFSKESGTVFCKMYILKQATNACTPNGRRQGKESPGVLFVPASCPHATRALGVRLGRLPTVSEPNSVICSSLVTRIAPRAPSAWHRKESPWVCTRRHIRLCKLGSPTPQTEKRLVSSKSRGGTCSARLYAFGLGLLEPKHLFRSRVGKLAWVRFKSAVYSDLNHTLWQLGGA